MRKGKVNASHQTHAGLIFKVGDSINQINHILFIQPSIPNYKLAFGDFTIQHVRRPLQGKPVDDRAMSAA